MGMWDTGCGMGCRIGVQHGAVGLEMWDGVQDGGVGCEMQGAGSPQPRREAGEESPSPAG